jgi:3-hydroxyacyl-CoA dehydrogenase
MVIEAVIEDIGLKQRIFVDLEAHCPPHTILSTNTSTINIELVGAKLKVSFECTHALRYCQGVDSAVPMISGCSY